MKAVLIPIKEGSNVTVDWGDGSPVETFTGAGSESNGDYMMHWFMAVQTPDVTVLDFKVGDQPYHEYLTDDPVDVKISGTITDLYPFPLIGFGSEDGVSPHMLDLKQWGDLEIGFPPRDDEELGDFAQSKFTYFNTPLSISATDSPNILPGSNLEFLITAIDNFTMAPLDLSTISLNNWDMSNVDSVKNMITPNMVDLSLPFTLDLSTWNLDKFSDTMVSLSQIFLNSQMPNWSESLRPNLNLSDFFEGGMEFILNVTDTSRDSLPFKIVERDGEVSYIDWGDGTIYNSTDNTWNPNRHTYASPGVYTVKVRGAIANTENYVDQSRMLNNVEMTRWGNVKILIGEYWDGNSPLYNLDLKVSATDSPAFIETGWHDGLFNCRLDGDLSNIDFTGLSGNRLFANSKFKSVNVVKTINLAGITSANQLFSNVTAIIDSSGNDINYGEITHPDPIKIEDLNLPNTITDIDSILDSLLPIDATNIDLTNVTSIGRISEATTRHSTLAGWNISNLTTVNMMFNMNLQINEDLSSWVVPEFTPGLDNWTYYTTSWTLPKPTILIADNKPGMQLEVTIDEAGLYQIPFDILKDENEVGYIDWGNGIKQTADEYGWFNRRTVYSEPGVYLIHIEGILKNRAIGGSFGGNPRATTLIEFKRWGGVTWEFDTSLEGEGANSSIIKYIFSATDEPSVNFTRTTSTCSQGPVLQGDLSFLSWDGKSADYAFGRNPNMSNAFSYARFADIATIKTLNFSGATSAKGVLNSSFIVNEDNTINNTYRLEPTPDAIKMSDIGLDSVPLLDFDDSPNSWNLGATLNGTIPFDITDVDDSIISSIRILGPNVTLNSDISALDYTKFAQRGFITHLFRNNTLFNQDLSTWIFPSTITRIGYDENTPMWEASNKPQFVDA